MRRTKEAKDRVEPEVLVNSVDGALHNEASSGTANTNTSMQHGCEIIALPICQIKIGERHRKDMGDLETFAHGIEELGLLHAVGVTENFELVFGERRLRAVRDVLGWTTIPARIIKIDHIVAGEYDENALRKEYTVSERVAIAKTLEREIPKRRGNPAFRQRIDELRGRRTDDVVAAKAGFGNRQTYRQAKKAVENGSAKLVVAMDEKRVSVPAAALLADADADQQDKILELDKKALLQVTREMQEKRFAAKREEKQRLRKRDDNLQVVSEDDQARVLCGDCFDLIPSLEDGSINLVLTSPPYAEQRKTQYSGVPEADFPQWAVKWMGLLKNKLAADGSVLIVIRPHLRQGVLSDYVLRTRLALRDDGWLENEELIWLKPNGPPLGSTNRPRRAWESILWFSKSQNPYCDLQACGHRSDRIGFHGPGTAWNGNSPIHGGTNPVLSRGTTRCCDVFQAPVGLEKVDHPAVYPVALAEQLIQTFSRPKDCVLDMFAGSGTSLVAAKMHHREYRGFDVEELFVTLALQRLAEVAPSADAQASGGVAALPWPSTQEIGKGAATESAPQLAL